MYLSAMRHRNVKNEIFVAISCVFSSPIHENSFSAGALPRTPLEKLTALYRPSSRLGRGTSLASRSWRLGLSGPRTKIPGYFYGLPNFFLAYSWPTHSKILAPPLLNRTSDENLSSWSSSMKFFYIGPGYCLDE